MSSGVYVLRGICPRGYVSEGECPGGTCLGVGGSVLSPHCFGYLLVTGGPGYKP